MHTLDGLSKRLPVLLEQRLRTPIDPDLIARQLHLNGWLGESLVALLLGQARQCVITVFPTDFGPEAVVAGVPLQDAGQRTRFPGFMVAQNEAQLTIPSELERAGAFIGRKYASRLGRVRVPPLTYPISGIAVDKVRKEAIATIEEVPLAMSSESEYWEQHIVPMIGEPFDQGRAVRGLVEAHRHGMKSAQVPHSPGEAWAREMMNYSLYSLCEMMKQHGRKAVYFKEQQTNDGPVCMSNIEYCVYYDPRIADRIFAGERQVRVEHISIL
jgi:hypothetical protein